MDCQRNDLSGPLDGYSWDWPQGEKVTISALPLNVDTCTMACESCLVDQL